MKSLGRAGRGRKPLSALPVGPQPSLPCQTGLARETLLIHYSDQMLLFCH